MSESAVIRFLYQGLASSEIVAAEPWGLAALDASPLSPEASAPAWTPGGQNGVVWLERYAPGLPAPLYVTGASSSTLDVARLLGERDCFPEWASVLSLRQTAGRGQLRRNWASPAGNLYAALRLPLEGPFLTCAAAPAIGALLAAALNALGFAVALKWPNDLLDIPVPVPRGKTPRRTDARKVGGILLEQRGDILTSGIGINVASSPPETALRDGAAFCAGTLALRKMSWNETLDAPTLLSSPSGNIFTFWLQLAAAVFSCYENRTSPDTWWLHLAERHLAFRGCRFVLSDAIPENDAISRSPCEGIVESITPSGALLLKTEHGSESFLGGSLLPANGDLPSNRS